MSEYQYYEFRAIDRSLTDQQMRELRAISTRAAISRTSFSNHYEYGDLKANPRDLLAKYFDVSLYFAHWAYLEVAFRFSKEAIDAKALRRYAAGHALDVRSAGADVVVSISVESDGDSFDAADDGSSWLSSLMGLRSDIAGGDERALYLAWLLDVQGGVIDDDAIEPSRPEGLGRLSPPLASFADIFGLDGDLVGAAASGDSTAPAEPAPRDIERWLAGLGPDEHLGWLSRVARGDGSVCAEIMRRFRRHTSHRAAVLPLRAAGELRASAEATAKKRRNADREREARERAKREQEQQAARNQYLTSLAKRTPDAWRRVDALIATKRPCDYTAAVTLLEDLRDVGERTGRRAEFTRRLSALREAHAKKPSFLARLKGARL
jgi:hypothetical protein